MSIKGDSFCRLSEKNTWSKKDTKETIQGNAKWNAKVDKYKKILECPK